MYLFQRNSIIFNRATIGQGYGLTETFAGAAFSEWDDTSVGRVGPPLPCCFIKVRRDFISNEVMNLLVL